MSTEGPIILTVPSNTPAAPAFRVEKSKVPKNCAIPVVFPPSKSASDFLVGELFDDDRACSVENLFAEFDVNGIRKCVPAPS